MSAPNRRARRSAEREMARLLRRMETQPERPILRAAERLRGEPTSPLPPEGGPGRGGDVPSPPASRPVVAPPPPSPIPPSEFHVPTSPSPLPEWARGLILPPGLDDDFRAGLFRFIEHHVRPRDPHEHRLAARIARAWARLEANARREPADQPGPLWLRYETLADRQLRQAERDLAAYRASLPPPAEPAPATPPAPAKLAPPSPTLPDRYDPTFALPLLTPPPMPAHARHLPSRSEYSRPPHLPHAHPADPLRY